MIYRVLGNIVCDLDNQIKVKNQLLYFPLNASIPKNVGRSNFKLYESIGHMMKRVLGNIFRLNVVLSCNASTP